MKRIIILTALSLGMSQMSAQTDFETYKRQQQQQFDSYRRQQKEDFEVYRAKLNAEYAEYMRKAWTQFNANTAKPLPQRPEPPQPVVKNPNEKPQHSLLPIGKVVAPVSPAKPVAPAVPLPDMKAAPSGFSFMYYGTPCRVSLNETHRFHLQGTSEGQVADAWSTLSDERFLPLLAECAQYGKELNLCDWGYVRLLQVMTESFFSQEQRNEAVLMQMYLLVQSGYKARIARANNRLILLLPIEQEVYNYSYLTIDDTPYYIIDKKPVGKSYHVFNRSFVNEKQLSLYISSAPNLKVKEGTERTLTDNKQLKVKVATNRNLIDFYNDYPRNAKWDFYSAASLSRNAKSTLYPTLRQTIEGKSKVEAANALLHFVQKAFDYQTDDVQFGTERPLFADEMLHYPYCDCEDRAIFYSILVRDLLGLDVVLLNYPRHLATAVCFDTDVPGDYLIVDNRRFTICDPTYINASVGESMPKLKQEKIEVVMLE